MIDILQYLPTGGMENAISQSALAALLRVDKRTVRALVYRARCKGAVICSTPDAVNCGYYLPECPADAVPYVRFQQARIRSARLALRSAELYTGGEEA